MRGKSAKVLGKYATFKDPENADNNLKRKIKDGYMMLPGPKRAAYKASLLKEMGK